MKAEDAIANVLLTARPGTIVEFRQPRAGKLQFTIEELRAAMLRSEVAKATREKRNAIFRESREFCTPTI